MGKDPDWGVGRGQRPRDGVTETHRDGTERDRKGRSVGRMEMRGGQKPETRKEMK